MSSLAERLPDAIRMITVNPDESLALARIVAVALQEVPGAQCGGVSAFSKHAIRTRAPSQPLVTVVDQAQYDAGEGPCLTAAVADLPVVVCDDLAADPRWPVFGRAASELGVNSVISFKLFDEAETIGALNLYAREAYAFPADAAQAGTLLAAHAAVVMTASLKQANLNVALETRDIIGQAKGILMERYKLDDRQAFDTLIAVSQHTHRKLREIAEQLRTTGELPEVGEIPTARPRS